MALNFHLSPNDKIRINDDVNFYVDTLDNFLVDAGIPDFILPDNIREIQVDGPRYSMYYYNEDLSIRQSAMPDAIKNAVDYYIATLGTLLANKASREQA